MSELFWGVKVILPIGVLYSLKFIGNFVRDEIDGLTIVDDGQTLASKRCQQCIRRR